VIRYVTKCHLPFSTYTHIWDQSQLIFNTIWS